MQKKLIGILLVISLVVLSISCDNKSLNFEKQVKDDEMILENDSVVSLDDIEM